MTHTCIIITVKSEQHVLLLCLGYSSKQSCTIRHIYLIIESRSMVVALTCIKYKYWHTGFKIKKK